MLFLLTQALALSWPKRMEEPRMGESDPNLGVGGEEAEESRLWLFPLMVPIYACRVCFLWALEDPCSLSATAFVCKEQRKVCYALFF